MAERDIPVQLDGDGAPCALRLVPVSVASLRRIVATLRLPQTHLLFADCATAAVDEQGRRHGVVILSPPLFPMKELRMEATLVVLNPAGGTAALLEQAARTVIQAMGYDDYSSVLIEPARTEAAPSPLVDPQTIPPHA